MKIVLLLFSQFETLDAFGPAEVLGRLPGCQIVCASVQGGICRSAQGVPVMTVPLSEAEGEVLLLLLKLKSNFELQKQNHGKHNLFVDHQEYLEPPHDHDQTMYLKEVYEYSQDYSQNDESQILSHSDSYSASTNSPVQLLKYFVS